MSAKPKVLASHNIEGSVLAIGAMIEILKSIATADISCGEKIDGCTIDWVARKLDEENEKIREAADRVRKQGR